MSSDQIPEETFSSDEEFDDGDDSGSSTDVDAKLMEEEVFDDEFFKCYSALKKKDSKIYDEGIQFFNEQKAAPEDDQDASSDDLKRKSNAPKMTLIDQQLRLATINPEDAKIDLNKPVSKSFYEKELEEIKRSIEKLSENVDSDSDDEFLIVKDSSTGGTSKRTTSLVDGMKEEEDDQIKRINEIWNDSGKLSKEDEFLRDYILNKRYLSTNVDSDGEDDEDRNGFFSKNIDELSDVEETQEDTEKDTKLHLHSEDKNFDKIARVPRNSTKTIRDIFEKQQKKEKRREKQEKLKKKKRSLKDADCEDLVGDLPTRFHYRETEPNDFGLSAEELLMATDEELEQWVSLRDTIAYKTEEEERAQKSVYDKKRHDLELKKKIFKSIYGDGEDLSIGQESSSSGSKTGKRNRDAEDDRSDTNSTSKLKADQQTAGTSESNRSKRKKKHKRGLKHKKFASSRVAPDRLLAYGLSKSKLKKRKLL